MATHSSALAWKIPWTEEPGGLQSMGSRRVRHDWATSLSLFTFMHWRRKWQPTPVFLPGKSQGPRSLVGCRLWGHTESDTTEGTWQQQQQPFNSSHTSLPPGVHTCILYICISVLALEMVHLNYFSRSYTYMLKYDACFSFYDLIRSVWQTLDALKISNFKKQEENKYL